MNNGYDLHTSEKIRNLGKDPKPRKRIVGFKTTALCFVMTFVVYFFVRSQTTPEAVTPAAATGIKSPLLVIIAVLLLVLCILVSILIKVIKNKNDKS
ncbi:MAG: hypothetical protein RR273_05970 [Oscillospiraceae bacterium]